MVNALKIYDMLEAAQIEPPKARVITDAVIRAIEENNVELHKTLATKEDLEKLEARLEIKIASLQSELIKWMFLFIMGQTAVLVGAAYFLAAHFKA